MKRLDKNEIRMGGRYLFRFFDELVEGRVVNKCGGSIVMFSNRGVITLHDNDMEVYEKES